jgi:large subunit ribosomal protein L35
VNFIVRPPDPAAPLLRHRPRARQAPLAHRPRRAYTARSIDPSGRYGLPRRVSHVLRTQETEMPKMKTKSGAKKRFKMTANGHVKVQQAGKRHGMIKRTTKFIRNARGTTVLSDQDAKIVKIYMPYAR